MESWNYALDGKGVLFSDELEFSVDPFARGGKGFAGWDRESVQSMDFIGFGFPEALKKPFHGDNIGVGMLSDIAVGGLNSGDLVMASPKMASNSSLETGSSHSTSLMETYSHDSSLIDLKLGRLADFSAAQDANFSKDGSVLSSASPNFQAKKARTMSSRNQAAFCQVYGCHKDLSLSKEYHKKHKVCEVHTKTPRVIVNGVEQRFCQQCSRFHLLVEFDDGKRSCRKRLAGHNARRRKPQFCTLSAKALKLLHPYQGTKFLGTSLPKRTSFLFPNIRPGCVLYPETYQQANWSSNVKLEEKPNHTPQLAVPLVNEEPAKSFFHLHGSGVPYAYEFSPATTADFHVLNTVSTIQKSAGALHSKRALSLLSAASQDLSHSAGNTTARSLINQAGHVPHSMGILNKPVNVGSLGKQVPNSLCSLGMNSAEVNYLGSLVSDTGHPANIHAQDGFVSDSLTAKYWDSSEHGSTMDLLQLSSHLQRVVQERNAIQVENENEELCSFLTTYRM